MEKAHTFGNYGSKTWRIGQLSRDRVSPDRCVFKACSENLTQNKRLTIRQAARLDLTTHASKARVSGVAPFHLENPMRVPQDAQEVKSARSKPPTEIASRFVPAATEGSDARSIHGKFEVVDDR